MNEFVGFTLVILFSIVTYHFFKYVLKALKCKWKTCSDKPVYEYKNNQQGINSAEKLLSSFTKV